MKLSLEKSSFLKALSHGQSVVEKRTTVPVLSHVLLTASEQGFTITATDMDMALIETVPAQVDVQGATCVPAHLIHDVVKKLSDRSVIDLEVNVEKGQLIVVSGRSRFELPCLSSEDFPLLTHGELSHRFSLPAPVFKYLIDTTRFAMSTEETRYHLNGIYFHTLEHNNLKVLRAVATDMHRLSCAECESPAEAFGMPDVIVSRKTIHEIYKLIEESEKPIEVGLSDNRIEFSIEGSSMRAVLSSRLIDGGFPDYSSALTINHDKTLIVPTKSFAEAVDRVGTVVNEKVRAIKVRLSNNAAILSAVSSESGSAEEELDVDYPYPDQLEICFNVKYLMDIAHQVTTEEMEVLLSDADSSVMIRPTSNPHVTFILMPMRV